MPHLESCKLGAGKDPEMINYNIQPLRSHIGHLLDTWLWDSVNFPCSGK